MPRREHAFGILLFVFAISLPVARGEPQDPPARLTPLARQTAMYSDAWVSAYATRGQRDARWNEDAEAFLAMCAEFYASRDRLMERSVALTDDHQRRRQMLAERLRDNGCDDPLVQALVAMQVEQGAGHRANGVAVAVGRFKGRYSLFTQQLVLSHMLRSVDDDLVRHEKWKGWVAESRANWMRDTCRGLTWDDWPRDHDRAFFRMAYLQIDAREGMQADVDQLVQRLAVVPKDRAWLALMLRGVLSSAAVWGVVPEGMTPDQRRGVMLARLSGAADRYQEAIVASADRPEPMIELIRLGLWHPDIDSATWFEAALAVDPDDYLAFSFMLTASHPDNGGDFAAMWRLGERALETGRWDTAVPQYCNFAVRELLKSPGGERWLKGRADQVWRTYRRFLEQRLDQGDRVPDEPAFYERRAIEVAYRLGLYPEAVKLLERVGWSEDNLSRFNVSGLSSGWVLAHLSAVREPAVWAALGEAQDAAAGGDADRAATLFDQASQQARSAPARQYIEHARRLSAWRSAFERGEWVDLIDAAPVGWMVHQGQWQLDDDGSFVGQPPEKLSQTRATCALPVGTRYEVELRVRRAPQWGDDGLSPQPGGVGLLVNGQPNLWAKDHTQILLAAGGKGWFREPGEIGDAMESEALDGKVVTFRIQRWESGVAAAANGEVFARTYRSLHDYQDDTVGLLSRYGPRLRLSVVAEGLRVRKLTQPPPELVAKHPPADPGLLR